MTYTPPHTPFFEASRPLEIAQTGRRLEVTKRPALEEITRSPAAAKKRICLEQARTLFTELQTHPEKYTNPDKVNAIATEIKDLINQAGVGRNIATLDMTGQKTTKEMQAHFDLTVRVALEHTQHPAPETPAV